MLLVQRSHHREGRLTIFELDIWTSASRICMNRRQDSSSERPSAIRYEVADVYTDQKRMYAADIPPSMFDVQHTPITTHQALSVVSHGSETPRTI